MQFHKVDAYTSKQNNIKPNGSTISELYYMIENLWILVRDFTLHAKSESECFGTRRTSSKWCGDCLYVQSLEDCSKILPCLVSQALVTDLTHTRW